MHGGGGRKDEIPFEIEKLSLLFAVGRWIQGRKAKKRRQNEVEVPFQIEILSLFRALDYGWTQGRESH